MAKDSSGVNITSKTTNFWLTPHKGWFYMIFLGSNVAASRKSLRFHKTELKFSENSRSISSNRIFFLYSKKIRKINWYPSDYTNLSHYGVVFSPVSTLIIGKNRREIVRKYTTKTLRDFFQSLSATWNLVYFLFYP